MEHLKKKFARLGFEALIEKDDGLSRSRARVPYAVTVVKDKKKGERFLISLEQDVEAVILDVRPDTRSLLLMITDEQADAGERVRAKMLLGHDERQLFVASAPRNVTTVMRAMEALKPREVARAEQKQRVKSKKRHNRKNKARVRQGDFFFVPVPELNVPEHLVLSNEPINRGRGSSHIVQFLYRTNGEAVWVCARYRNGVTEKRYRAICESKPAARKWNWQRRVRNAEVYAKGRVTHREHATVTLDMWHRVFPNAEATFPGFTEMGFID